MRKQFFHLALISAALSLVVFIFSFLNNTFLTSLIRAVYGLIFFPIVILPAYWYIRRVLLGADTGSFPPANTGQNIQPVGQHIDLVTPEEGISRQPGDMDMDNDKDSDFIPWIPGQKIADREIDAKKIAQSLNLFADDKGR